MPVGPRFASVRWPRNRISGKAVALSNWLILPRTSGDAGRQSRSGLDRCGIIGRLLLDRLKAIASVSSSHDLGSLVAQSASA
jgi:hypothetical protein